MIRFLKSLLAASMGIYGVYNLFIGEEQLGLLWLILSGITWNSVDLDKLQNN